ncbi:MAG TPA: ABC transporter permease [Candidatus Acidoferrum sp.]|nr:ABC transporter permease [Candidatus Acidoferrum sp.]
MKAALAVWERDIRKFMRQPAVVMAAIIGPFLSLVLLGYAFGGAITYAPVAVVRESNGQFSSEFVGILRTQLSCQYGGVNCQNSYTLIDASDLASAQVMLRKGLVKAIIFIPLGFDQALATHTNTQVNVYLDNTDPISAAAITGELTQAAQQLSTRIQINSPTTTGINVILADFYRNVFYIEFMAPGSLVQSIMFASIIGGGISILEDKERGIIEGYLVSPLKQYEIIVGVLFAGVTKAMFSATTLFVLSLMIGAIRPSAGIVGYVLMFFTLFLTSLGVISMMTAYAVRATSRNAYTFTAFPINITLYFTSGAVYPTNGFPTWMQEIAKVNPEAYAVDALRLLIYKGAGLTPVLGDFAFLTVFTVIMIALATLAFKRAL